MNTIFSYLKSPTSIAPLITFRVLFGLLMCASTIRFWYLGWIENHYIDPVFHFKYYGFEWIEAFPAWVMYALHVLLVVASLGVMLGFWYRISAILVFLIFTYCQLIDLTYYLNHYYFVSLVSFWLIFAPAHRYFSLDALPKKWSASVAPTISISTFWIFIFKIQLGITYFYAGLAKINTEWLFDAMPLRIWLPPHYEMPILGSLMSYAATAYIFSWVGMIYDLLVPFALAYRKTRLWAYLAVIGFHTVTGYLFQIGVFPVVMILLTLIFFDAKFHERLWNSFKLKEFNFYAHLRSRLKGVQVVPSYWIYIVGVYLLFQLLFPFRFLLYKGNMFWTEQGYRFGWRVMLMEKAGSATFYVKNPITGKEGMVDNREFLNAHQEKQLAMQPDMILQYAHFLKKQYTTKENPNPIIRAEVYVTLNGRRSQLYFDPNLDLATLNDSFAPKDWLYSLKK